MKFHICIILTVVAQFSFVGSAGAADVQVRVVRNGKDVSIPDTAAFTTNVIELLRSCSVNHTPEKNWNDVVRSDSFIQIRFTNPPVVKVWWGGIERQGQTIDEIRIWLSEGKWPTVQARSDTATMGCGKYDPIALKRVVSEPALDLASVRPYDSLMALKENNL
jgi:hypothetical protein